MFVAGTAGLATAQVEPLTPEFMVNTTTAVPAYLSDGGNPNTIAMTPDGRFVVVWYSPHDGAEQGVFGQRFASDGSAVGDEFLVNTFTGNPGGGNQYNPSVTMDANGNFVASWTNTCPGACGVVSPSVFAQRFDSTGAKLGGEFRIDTDQQGISGGVAAAANGDFVVVWNGTTPYSDGWGGGIFARRYSSAGELLQSDFQVNTFTGGNPNTGASQTDPKVAAAPNGDFVVVWASAAHDGYSYPVHGQRFASDGTPLGTEFRANTSNVGFHTQPVVSVAGDGDFVVAWTDTTSLYPDIFAQRFASTGDRLGSEFLVNTYTPGTQRNPSVAADADGDFIVTWASFGPGGGAGEDGHGSGIFGQRYTSTGERQGDEFLVNQYTQGDQGLPNAVSSDGAGNFVVVFQAYGRIEGRGFAVPTDPPTLTPTITQTPTITNTPLPSDTPTESATVTETPTAVDTATPTATQTDSPTAVPSATPPSTGTATPSVTPTATPTYSPSPTHTATATATHSPPLTPAAPPCVGDCNGGRVVSIDELLRGVNIALGNQSLDQCLAFDPNGDGQVTINELLRGVNNALNGCPTA